MSSIVESIPGLSILKENMDVYFAIALLLKNKISGAPVINDANKLVGILSEKDCLRVFANGSFHNLPASIVADYMSWTWERRTRGSKA